MEISIYDAKTHLSSLIQQLIEEKEDIIDKVLEDMVDS